MGKRKRIAAKFFKGFTLIELLVVIAILAVLLGIVILAINPFEQFSKAHDVSTLQVSNDYNNAAKYFYAKEKTTLWSKNAGCLTELSSKTTASEMPSCMTELTDGGNLQAAAITSNEAKDIHITQCNDSLAFCYKVKSKVFSNNPEAKYSGNGALKTGCPGGDDCYICNFTTNEAQECFEAMQPNADLAQATANPDTVLPVVPRDSKNVCNEPVSGQASCMADVVTDSQGNPLSTFAPPGGFTPEHLHKAYNLPCTPGGTTVNGKCTTPTSFGPETVAVILAFHSPTIEQDLAVYSSTYGLPPCTTTNGCLSIVNQNGTSSPLPTGQNSAWAMEESLDVEMAHAICQTCKVLLVEADSNSFLNLGIATKTAGNLGATVISNSYGGAEGSYASAYDQYYDQPGVGVTAATGDWGYGAYYPASSNKVIAVSGTALSIYSDFSYAGESVWNLTGSGCSNYQSALSFQTSLANWSQTGCGTKRAIGDVSADASPSTGASIYTSSTYYGRSGWWIVGGTSLSSPLYAGVLALQGGVPKGVDGVTIPYQNKDKFRDVTSGSNGSCGNSSCTAGPGYDGPTGLGSPNLLPSGDITPTVIPTKTSTSTPSPSPKNIISSSDPAYGYAVDTYHHLVTKVSRLGTSLGNICLEGEKLYCYGSFILSPSDKTSNYCQDYIGNSIPVYTQVGCDSNFTDIPWPTPTPAYPNCSQQHTLSLKDTTPILATPGSKVTTTLILKNNNTGSCNPITYNINAVYPGNTYPDTWSVTGNFNSFLLGTGEAKELVYTINVPSVGLSNKDYSAKFSAQGYLPSEYTYWWVKPIGDLNAIVRVTGAPPTVTPTPKIPAECITQPTVTLSEPLILGLPGTKIKSKMTIKSNASPTCDPVFYTVSYSIPTGWGLLQRGMYRALLPNVTDTIDYTLYLPSDGLVAQDYNYQFWITTAGQPSVDPVIVNGITRVSLADSIITPTPTSLPTPTPTPAQNCSTQQTVSLTPTTPVLALPGDTVNFTITVLSNDSPGCSSSYTISQGFPTGWTISGVPASFTLAGGATKTIYASVTVSPSAPAETDTIQFWVAKQGQTIVNPVNGYVQVQQIGPTNTPTPTPISCAHAWSQSLGSTSLSGNAGDTLNETLTVTNNNPPSCGSAVFGISYSYPSGWIINGLMPPSVSVGGGETKTIPITITISTGALIQDYQLQFWVNNGSNNMNATVHVLSTSQPPAQQMFSNFNPKMYGSYALFEYSYNATGAVSGRLDVATDPSLLNQTSGSSPNARYGFAFNSGSAMDASNKPTPSTVEGFISSSPQSWSGWKCGSTIYYRMYNSGDLRIASPIESGVVDCTTVIDVLPWSPWYSAIYQGVYDARYDADNNGIIDYTDYWILVRATRLR